MGMSISGFTGGMQAYPVQEQTKEEMDLSEISASAMGFGSKLQMELMGIA